MVTGDTGRPSFEGSDAAGVLATELRRLRRERGLSMRDMAGPLHLSAHSAVADYESGHRLPADDILSAYERFFDLDPGCLRDLRRRALAERAAAEAVAAGAARGGPAQLPHDTGAFVGRRAELRRLRDVARGARRDAAATILAVCAIDGTAGIGKTALAVRFARQIADRYPDGQLYLDLRGYSPDAAPLTPTQALGQLLRSLGVDTATMPSDPVELASRYRTALAGRQVLVVLDNASCTGQVRPLLPGHPGCLTLVTSRATLSGLVARDGAHRTVLGVLAADEAVALLAEVVGATRVAAEPEAAARIAELCGGLPLALRIAAEQATLRADAPLAVLAAELSDEHTVLARLTTDDDEVTGVRAAFSWSYRALPEPVARFFRRVAVHPGDRFTGAAAAAAAAVTPDEADAALDTLLAAHLVERIDGAWYRMHDLVRLYARERLGADDDPDETRAATERICGWYLHSTLAAARTVRPARRLADLGDPPRWVHPAGFDGYDDALAWLDAEHRNCAAAAGAAARLGLDAIAVEFPAALWDVFDLRGLVEEWQATIETALGSAERLGATAARAKLLSHLASSWLRIGRTDNALPLLYESLDLRRQVGDRIGEGSTLSAIGNALLADGRLDEAVATYRDSVALSRQTGYVLGEAMTLANIGLVHGVWEQWDLMAEACGQALAKFDELGDVAGRGRCHAYLAWASVHLADPRRAGAHAETAIELARACGQRDTEAMGLRYLAMAHEAAGEPDRAAPHWREAIAVYESMGDPAVEEVRREMAHAWDGTGKPPRPRPTLR